MLIKNQVYIFSFAAAIVATACGGKPPVNTTYKGPPLATLRGQLTDSKGLPIDGPVRLAVAWYTGITQKDLPKAIVTQDVVYQGSFPINFTVELPDLPPAEALSAFSENGQTGNTAFGVVIAYQDVNGDGTLDVIPPGGKPIDKILGASGLMTDAIVADQYAVIYSDTALAAVGTQPTLPKGYNLLKYSNASNGSDIVPFNTPINIDLSGDPSLNFIVCDEAFANNSPPNSPFCGLVFRPTPARTILLDRSSQGADLGVRNFADISLRDADGKVITGAGVVVNGRTLPFVNGEYVFEGTELLLHSGANDVSVSAPGEARQDYTVMIPNAFTIASPAADAQEKSGVAFGVEWSASPPDDLYVVQLHSLDGSGATNNLLANDPLITDGGNSVQIAPAAYTGRATLTVEAERVTYAADGTQLIGSLRTSETILFVP